MKRLLIAVSLFISQQGLAEEFLVKYTDSRALQSILFKAQQKTATFLVQEINETANLVKVEVPDRVRISGLLKLWAQPGVQYVVPNFKLHSYLLRSSAYSTPVHQTTLKEQWAIGKVNAEKAWAKAGNKGNRKVLVAVIDTGADYKHESLAPNMVPGYDFKENDNDPMDKTGFQNPGHGTHCAGAIGATGLIEGGIIGLAPEISLMPLRFLGEDGSGDLNAAIKAIDYAIEKGVHVISASWGATVPRSTAAPLLEAIKRADDKGIIFVSAAANDGA
ncbi:MAG: S8 family serine peptidase, partial [Pseudobdellovibrionaceae bacterium]